MFINLTNHLAKILSVICYCYFLICSGDPSIKTTKLAKSQSKFMILKRSHSIRLDNALISVKFLPVEKNQIDQLPVC